VTIRHIIKEGEVQHAYFKSKEKLSYEEFHKASTYVSKLELWANTIRFKRNSEERRDFERVLHELQVTLQEVCPPRSPHIAASTFSFSVLSSANFMNPNRHSFCLKPVSDRNRAIALQLQ
jgi:hypothetical protein